MNFEKLYNEAKSVINPRQLSPYVEAGGVGAALLTNSGNIFVGACLDTPCSLGFCAERAAAASMITAGKNQVVKMIAVDWDGKILPPCGTCREFISQLHEKNYNAEVMVAEGKVMTLEELMPFDWKKKSNKEERE